MESNSHFAIPDYVIRELADLDGLARKGIAVVPPPRFIAAFVKFQRAMLGWKQDALASFAGVSLSTIERIERGESVSALSLERVTAALAQRPGAFTDPRIPLRGDKLEQKAAEGLANFKDRIWVPVRPLRTQPQVAALVRTHLYLIDGGRLGDACNDEIAALQETLDFVAFLLTNKEDGSATHREPLKRRELYANVLCQVKAIEQRARAVTLAGAGTYKAETNAPVMPVVDVALVGFFPLSTDPGAIKRRELPAPAKVDLVEAWQRFCREND